MGKRKRPERVAVLVRSANRSGYHPEVIVTDKEIYLLEVGAPLPENGELVVLEQINQRPGWWGDRNHGRWRWTEFSRTNKYKDIYLWRIVCDE